MVAQTGQQRKCVGDIVCSEEVQFGECLPGQNAVIMKELDVAEGKQCGTIGLGHVFARAEQEEKGDACHVGSCQGTRVHGCGCHVHGREEDLERYWSYSVGGRVRGMKSA